MSSDGLSFQCRYLRWCSTVSLNRDCHSKTGCSVLIAQIGYCHRNPNQGALSTRMSHRYRQHQRVECRSPGDRTDGF